MNISAKFDKGTLVLDLHQMVESVPIEYKLEMIESLSCDEDIIRHITDQIIGKWTESGYCGGYCFTASPDPSWSALDRAWRIIAKASGEIAAKEITRLEGALRKANEENQRLLEDRRQAWQHH